MLLTGTPGVAGQRDKRLTALFSTSNPGLYRCVWNFGQRLVTRSAGFLRQYGLVVLVGLPAPLTRESRQARKGAAAAGAWVTGSGGRGPPLFFLTRSCAEHSGRPSAERPGSSKKYLVISDACVFTRAFPEVRVGIFLREPCFYLFHFMPLSERLRRSLPMFEIHRLA